MFSRARIAGLSFVLAGPAAASWAADEAAPPPASSGTSSGTSSGPLGRYTIKEGDTLSVISMNLLGTMHRMNELMELNPKIQQADNIFVGQAIVYPLDSKSAEEPKQAHEPTAPRPPPPPPVSLAVAPPPPAIVAAVKANNPEQAQQAAKELVKTHAEDPQAHVLAARVFASQGPDKAEAAIKEFDQARALLPDDLSILKEEIGLACISGDAFKTKCHDLAVTLKEKNPAMADNPFLKKVLDQK